MPSAVVILGRADKICENLCMHLAHCGRKLILVSDDLELLQNNVAQLEEEGAQVFGIFQDFGDVDAEELVARKVLGLDTCVDTLICSVYQVNTTIATQNPFPAGLKNAFLFYLSQYLVDRAAFHEGSRIVIISAPKKQDLFVVQMLRRIYVQYQVTTVRPPPPEKAAPALSLIHH